MVIHLPPLAAAISVKNVINGLFSPGFHTPGGFWGSKFVFEIPTTSMRFLS